MQALPAIDALLLHLGAGDFGVLRTERPDPAIQVHVAGGEILAATSDGDTAAVLRRLVNRGLLDPDEARRIGDAATDGTALARLLDGPVSPEVLLARFTARFEDNLARFLLASIPPRFEPRPADAAPAVRMAGEPGPVLMRASAAAERARDLVDGAGVRVLAPGSNPGVPADAPLLERIRPGMRVVDLLDLSPDETIETAARLRDLLDRGVLVAEEEEPPVPVVEDHVPDPSDVGAGVEQRFSLSQDRPAGVGEFIVEKHLLDYVDLDTGAHAPPADDEDDLPLEMDEGDPSRVPGAVTLSLTGPALPAEEARRKAQVVNEVLVAVAAAFSDCEGPGAGRARVQALLQGAPLVWQGLFRGLEARKDGSMDADLLVQNLQKRPASERRRALNGALQDLVERSLTLAAECVEGERFERLLESLAGFQKRLGL